MKTVVVGGHSRKVGKTSVASGLIRGLREYSWTAVKISSHWHAENSSLNGREPEEDFSILEETNRGGLSDTSRFLAAGAARSFWVRFRNDGLTDAIHALLPILKSSDFVMIESNRVLEFVPPDIYLVVLRYDVEDFKESARRTLAQAHAAVVLDCGSATPSWKKMTLEVLAPVPVFVTRDARQLPEGLIEWVGARLA